MVDKIKRIIPPVLIVCLYLVFTYFSLDYEWKHGLLVGVKGPEPIDLKVKFICDFVSSLLIVIILILITLVKKQKLKDMGLTFKSPILILVLLAVYIIMFIINRDFTAKGFYAAFFYLVVVAFSEEFIFRGYLFTAIDKEFGFWIAVIISGILFGATHAFIPAITRGYTTQQFIMEILSNLLGQGILGTAFFAFLYKKSKTLFVPILIHAIMNYTGVLFS